MSTKAAADNLADKDIDSTDTELRYAAYGARLRTALRASQRYLAYVPLFPRFDQRSP
jgi:mitochondrial fission process protein 1